ncbi:hypothetical protein KI387_014549, partial [Taxus chinensis]
MMAWMHRQSVSKLIRSWPAICGRNLSSVREFVDPPPMPVAMAMVDLCAPVLCGRGDKKTKKGKRFKGTFGNSRPKKDKQIARIKEK